MYTEIVITFKDKYRISWNTEKWDDFSCENGLFIVKKKGAWVGIYNLDCIRSIEVK